LFSYFLAFLYVSFATAKSTGVGGIPILPVPLAFVFGEGLNACFSNLFQTELKNEDQPAPKRQRTINREGGIRPMLAEGIVRLAESRGPVKGSRNWHV
jgi:hypothetical protein